MNEKSELDWLAFRYVSDELTADEAASFEGQLEVDQNAREAVASAVELCQAIAAPLASDKVLLPVGSSAESPSRRLRVIGWSGAALAACLAAVLIVNSLGHRWRPDRPSGDDAPSRAQELAMAWNDLRDAGPEEDLPGSESTTDDLASATLDLEAPLVAQDWDDFDVASELAAPSWLLSAVVGEPESEMVEDSAEGSDVGEES